MPDGQSNGTSFEEFVREIEENATDEERAELDAWRDYFRRERDGGDEEAYVS